jgi:hypothetical protein
MSAEASTDIKDSTEAVSPKELHADDFVSADAEEQTKDPREPKVKTSIPMVKVIGLEFLWILIGGVFAAGMGIIPLMV